MEIRPYAPEDAAGCLALCDEALRPAFRQFLDTPGNLHVMEHEDRVVGCGGYSIDSPSSASLRWGMIHAECRRMGLGRFLLLFRLRELGKAGGIATVTVSPPDEFAGFYVKQGFHPAGSVLVKKLTVCS